MEQAVAHVSEGITKLFKIAETNIKLAKRIYELSKSDFYHFDEIKPYLKSGETQVMSFAAMISMDNFPSELDTQNLISFQRSSDSLVRARARVLGLQRKPKKSDFGFLLETQKPPFCIDEAHLARELLLIGFEDRLTVDLLFEFLKSSNEEIRSTSKNRLLSRSIKDFSPEKLKNYAGSINPHESSLAAEILLKKFPKSLAFDELIELQSSECETVRVLARKVSLGLQKNDLIFEKLSEYRKSKHQGMKDLAIELIIKNFDFHLSGVEIFELQKSKSAIIRGLGRDLALSSPPSRWTGNVIKKAKVSHDFETRKLAIELDEKITNSNEINSEALNFLAKYGF